MTRLLIVDDEPLVLKAMARSFRITGYEILTAGHPADALARFQAGERFDAVISDMEMPGMHGDELCREVQKIVSTPFILQSGNPAVTARAIDCGASYGFVKPVDPPMLREAVAELIRHRASG